MLETRGYRVLPMSSGREALDHLENCLPGSVDLLLSDLSLPSMDGNELVRRAKQCQPALPALLVSAATSNFDRASAADAFLGKGACSAAELLDRVRVLVARKRGPKKQVAVLPFAVASAA